MLTLSFNASQIKGSQVPPPRSNFEMYQVTAGYPHFTRTKQTAANRQAFMTLFHLLPWGGQAPH